MSEKVKGIVEIGRYTYSLQQIASYRNRLIIRVFMTDGEDRRITVYTDHPDAKMAFQVMKDRMESKDIVDRVVLEYYNDRLNDEHQSRMLDEILRDV